MDHDCSARESGQSHIWRKHGHHRRPDGSLVQRWQCRECEQTTIKQPDDDSGPTPRPGPKRGHTADHPEAYESFWREVGRQVFAVGLYEAARIAAQRVGVHETTGWRWIKRPLDRSLEWWEEVLPDPDLIFDALRQIRRPRLRREIPSPEGMDAWRIMMGWQHLTDLEGDFSEPPESKNLRLSGPEIWAALLSASCVAAAVVGNGSPLGFASIANITTRRVERLRAGGLLNRRGGPRHFTYWLVFVPPDPDARDLDPYITGPDPYIAGMVATRSRVVGVGFARVPYTWPGMIVRLDLDNAVAKRHSVTIPVPGATLLFHRRSLKFPLELDLRLRG